MRNFLLMNMSEVILNPFPAPKKCKNDGIRTSASTRGEGCKIIYSYCEVMIGAEGMITYLLTDRALGIGGGQSVSTDLQLNIEAAGMLS